MKRFETIMQPANLARLGRFLLVGLSGTLVDFSLLAMLKSASLATLPANTLSFSAGIVNNFILNRSWTFRGASRQPWLLQFAMFALVSFVGLALNNAIVLWLEPLFSTLLTDRLAYLPAKVAATGAVVFWNYFANLAWTFRATSCNEVNNDHITHPGF